MSFADQLRMATGKARLEEDFRKELSEQTIVTKEELTDAAKNGLWEYKVAQLYPEGGFTLYLNDGKTFNHFDTNDLNCIRKAVLSVLEKFEKELGVRVFYKTSDDITNFFLSWDN